MQSVVITVLALVAVSTAQFFGRSDNLLQRTYFADPSGQVSQSYSVNDGTHVEDHGVLKPLPGIDGSVLVKSGSYRFITPDGVTHQVTYTADEYGYHPVSSDIPVQGAPAVPTF